MVDKVTVKRVVLGIVRRVVPAAPQMARRDDVSQVRSGATTHDRHPEVDEPVGQIRCETANVCLDAIHAPPVSA